ncbi:pyrroline-5-carboxylate reductase [soil metagenome]
MTEQSTEAELTRDVLAGVKLGFVGAGVMAEAMIAGLLNQKLLLPDQMLVSHPRTNRRDDLVAKYGIRAVEANQEVATDCDLLLLTVKPQVLKPVMKQLRGMLEHRQVVLSIIAGASIGVLAHGLGHSEIVRVMPNTPAQIGRGMMVWTSTPSVDEASLGRVRAVLGALGEELWVDEEKYVDMATALSGTGPTYVFLMMEALIDAGVHMGFPRRIAEQIVLQTVAGSVDFAKDSGKHMAELRNMVTSPGGTSAEAIYQMEKGGLRTVYSRAVYAAYQRTRSLAQEDE